MNATAGMEDDRSLIIKGSIHLLFLVGTIGLAYIDHLQSVAKSYTREGKK
jgi:hypothetical protein